MTSAAAPEPPPLERFQSRADFIAALHWGVQAACARGARHMVWADADFADWPLGDAALLDALSAWLRLPQRRLQLLALDYEHLPRRHARFARWREDWSHAVAPWTPPEELVQDMPRGLVDDGPVSVVLLDALIWRGRASSAVRDALRLREKLDVVLQRSASAWPLRPLGL